MKFREIAKGKRAWKPVTYRLANAPVESAQPGQDSPEDPHLQKVGVRVLTGEETAMVYQRAATDAAAKGVAQWEELHPICRVYEMAHTLHLACVDVDAPAEPYFESATQVLDDPQLGTDNIAYLFEQHSNFQDECSFQKKTLSVEEVL